MTESATALRKSLLAGGEFDHPVTGAALLQLGKLLFEQGKYEAAAGYFHEATVTAAQFGQHDDIEEAFRYGAITHMITGQRGIMADPAVSERFANAACTDHRDNAHRIGNTSHRRTERVVR